MPWAGQRTHQDDGVVVDAPVLLDRQAGRVGVALAKDPQLVARALFQVGEVRDDLLFLPFGEEVGHVDERHVGLLRKQVRAVDAFRPGTRDLCKRQDRQQRVFDDGGKRIGTVAVRGGCGEQPAVPP